MLTWNRNEDSSDCSCERTEVRDGASGDLIVVFSGGVNAAAILCSDLPDEGALRVICVGGDGSRAEGRCEYVCVGPDPRPHFLRADCNDDGTVDIADPVATLFAIFLGEFEITCEDACDSNDDRTVDISDPITTLAALFLGNATIPILDFATLGCSSSPVSQDLI